MKGKFKGSTILLRQIGQALICLNKLLMEGVEKMDIKNFILLAFIISILIFMKFILPLLERKYRDYKLKQKRNAFKLKMQKLEIK